jgi:hypothetical protein
MMHSQTNIKFTAVPFHRDKDVLYEEVDLEELLVGKNFSTMAEHGTCGSHCV